MKKDTMVIKVPRSECTVAVIYNDNSNEIRTITITGNYSVASAKKYIKENLENLYELNNVKTFQVMQVSKMTSNYIVEKSDYYDVIENNFELDSITNK